MPYFTILRTTSCKSGNRTIGSVGSSIGDQNCECSAFLTNLKLPVDPHCLKRKDQSIIVRIKNIKFQLHILAGVEKKKGDIGSN